MKRRAFVMSGLGPLVLSACGGGGTDDVDSTTTTANASALDAGSAPEQASEQPWGAHGVVTWLEPVDGTETSGRAVNDRGQVTGWTGAGEAADFGTTLWTPGRPPVRFATLGGFGSAGGASINAAGWIVGNSTVSDTQSHATLWRDGQSVDLGTLNGAQASSATNINNAGLIVGWSYIGPGSPMPIHAVLWQRGQMVDLGTLGGDSSSALDINNAGVIVGWADADQSTGTHAALWQHGTVTDVGIPGYQTTAYAINDRGLVVGSSTALGEAASVNAIMWVNATPTTLPTLGGERAIARDVNNAGLIVGWSSLAGDDGGHAVLWQGDQAIDLNLYLDRATREAGWYLGDATGISNSGWVTGDAYNTITGAHRAYRLALRRRAQH